MTPRLVAAIPRLVAVAVGVWLMAAPAVLGYESRAADSDRSVGPFIAALSFVALWELGRGLRWLTVPLGGWLVVAPLVLWYDEPAASINSVACGVLVVAMAPAGDRRRGAFAGGRQTVRRLFTRPPASSKRIETTS